MKFYDVTEEIDAPPEKVWGILTDGEFEAQKAKILAAG